MTDDFEGRVETWLRERARPDSASLAAVRGSIDALPRRRRSAQRGWLAGIATVVAIVAIGTSALFFSSRPNGTGPSIPSRPIPPDPAAFAGDPRLHACYGSARPVEFAFEMPHARDYQRHFPAMLLAPELDVDDPAFAVVFARGALGLIGGSRSPSATADLTANPNKRWVCILVGGTPNAYGDVDISGMRVVLGDIMEAPSSGSPTSSPVAPSSTPTLTPGAPPSARVDEPWRDSNLVHSGFVRTTVGPEHCGWQSTVWMYIDDKELYLRDPDGVFADVEIGTFVPDTALPSDAQDTGLSSAGRRLFTVPSGDAVYVQTSTGVERWPRSTDPFLGCA